MSGISNLVNELIEMQQELEFLRFENKELRKYKQLYFDLMDNSLTSSRNLMGTVLVAALEGCVQPKEMN